MLSRKERKITWKKGDVVFISGTSSSMGKGKRQQVLKINDNFTFLVGEYRTLHQFIIPLQKINRNETTQKIPNIVPEIVTSVNKQVPTQDTKRE